CCRSARFSRANSRCARRQLLTVAKRIPTHRTMTAEIADQSANHKAIATDQFSEGTTGRCFTHPRLASNSVAQRTASRMCALSRRRGETPPPRRWRGHCPGGCSSSVFRAAPDPTAVMKAAAPDLGQYLAIAADGEGHRDHLAAPAG